MRRRFLAILPLLVLMSTTALATQRLEFRSFKGTWLCPTCLELKQPDTPENCEAKGHEHAIMLNDGQMVTFVNNARSAFLIHGGGREKAKIEVCGLYDPQTHTMDVDAYEIDGAWSTWCDVHNRMDLCRSSGKAAAKSGVAGDGQGAK